MKSLSLVIPAQAGILDCHEDFGGSAILADLSTAEALALDSRLRGNDGKFGPRNPGRPAE
jgi:hypothetical protein